MTIIKWCAALAAAFTAWVLFDEHEAAISERFDQVDDAIAALARSAGGRAADGAKTGETK